VFCVSGLALFAAPAWPVFAATHSPAGGSWGKAYFFFLRLKYPTTPCYAFWYMYPCMYLTLTLSEDFRVNCGVHSTA